MNYRALVFVPALAACAAGGGAPRTIAAVEAVPTGGTSALERAALDRDAPPIARGFVVGAVDVRAAVELRPGTCTEFGVGLSRGVVDADLEAFAEDGTLLARDRAVDRFARIRLCTNAARHVVLRAFAADGAGEIELVAVAATDTALAPTAILAPETTADTALAARLSEAVESRGFVVDSRATPVVIDASVPLRVPISVPRGECVSVAFRGDAEVRMTLVDGDGASVASDTGAARDLVVDGCRGATAEAWSVGFESAVATRGRLVVARAAEARVGGATGLGGMR